MRHCHCNDPACPYHEYEIEEILDAEDQEAEQEYERAKSEKE